jgi:VCBS repeat-containing protein
LRGLFLRGAGERSCSRKAAGSPLPPCGGSNPAALFANDGGGVAKSFYGLGTPFRPIIATELGGTVTFQNGVLTYTPPPSFDSLVGSNDPQSSATDSFTYTIQLGNGALSTATVTLRINGVDDLAVITGTSGRTKSSPAATPTDTFWRVAATTSIFRRYGTVNAGHGDDVIFASGLIGGGAGDDLIVTREGLNILHRGAAADAGQQARRGGLHRVPSEQHDHATTPGVNPPASR